MNIWTFVHLIVCSNQFFHTANNITITSSPASVVSTNFILKYRSCLVLLKVCNIFVHFSNKWKGFSYTDSPLIHLSAGSWWRGSECYVDDDSNCTHSSCLLIGHYQHSTGTNSLLHQETCEVRINLKAHASSRSI